MTKRIVSILLLILAFFNIPSSYQNTFSQANVKLKLIRKNEDIFIQILVPQDMQNLKIEIISEEGITKNIIYKDYFTTKKYAQKKYNEFIVSNKGNNISETDIIKVYNKARIIVESSLSSIPSKYIIDTERDGNGEKKSIRIMTYNIHRGRDKIGNSNLKSIAEPIKYYDVDIIGLQEVDKNVSRTNFEDQLKILADSLSMYYYFGSNKSFLKGEYGNGVLSKFPLQDSENILMVGKGESRGLLRTTVLIDDNKKLNFIVTHLGLDEEDRHKQFQSLLDYIDMYNGELVLIGDFNVTDSDPNILKIQQRLNDVGEKTNYKYKNTLNIFKNEYRIDYVFTSKAMKIKRYRVEKVQYSDHFPVIVDIEL